MPSFEASNDRLGLLHGLTQDFAPPPPHKSAMSASSLPASDRSSKRRERSRSRHRDNHPESKRSKKDSNDEKEPEEGDEWAASRKSKFRFKKHRSSRREHRHNDPSSQSTGSKRRKQTYSAPIDDPTEYDDTYIPNLSSMAYSSEAAFRESLFDAMADDEGAAFWEGVYGQPVHIYTREYTDSQGELERMDDEEYARYVREKMWEKSHEHIIEERRRREKEKAKEKARKQEEEEEWRWREKEERRERRRREEGVARRERRRHRKERMGSRWDEYTAAWKTILAPTQPAEPRDRLPVPWPVESGKLADVEKDAVEKFFFSAPVNEVGSSGDLFDLLKTERVRWHPDKAQQRWGRDGLEEKELRGITAVFQAVDGMWAAQKDKRERMRAKE
ncbi:hypothetical protein RUND412_007079 [Rhizina undulata]